MHSWNISSQDTRCDAAKRDESAFPAPPGTLDPDLLTAVMMFSTPIHCAAGDTVISQGESAPVFYYIQEGTVAVSHSEGHARIVVALIGQGNFIGEIGFFDGISRVREAQAIGEAQLMRFDEKALERLFQKNPAIYGRFILYLTRSICAKFRRVLDDREPVQGYAAALSGKKKDVDPVQPLPDDFFFTRPGKEASKMVEDFKASMFNLSYRLQADAGKKPPENLQQLGFSLLDAFKDRLEAISRSPIDPDLRPFLWGYIFKEIFPYFMRSRFAERVYYKPRGYAGDYLMIDMIYNNTPEGDGKIGTLVDAWALSAKAPEAVRGRRRLLAEQLETLSHAITSPGRPVQIMNLACGPCREVADFLSRREEGEKPHFLLVDIDEAALQHADTHLKPFSPKAGITLVCENILKWAIGRSTQDFGSQDIIYSSGLTDYLEDRFFVKLVSRCHERLNPGGTLLVGNFGPRNPDRAFMENILEWHLIHRSESDLQELFSQTPFGDRIEFLTEPLGVNIFVKAVKT